MVSKIKGYLIALGIVAALLALAPTIAQAQSSPRHYISTASTNSTEAFAAKGYLTTVSLTGASGTGFTYYLKLYDTATAPTCGSGAPFWTIGISDGTVISLTDLNLLFTAGLGFCLTANVADSDATVAGAGVAIDLGLSGSPNGGNLNP